MATAADWWHGARPRTLPAAIAPVAVGSGVAAFEDGFVWDRALLALVVALALQVGVNYANDYSDGVRGTDHERVGPVRLVASGLAEPTTVKRAAYAAFAAGALAGLVLALLTQAWWLVVVGAAAIVAAWYYTGGRNPYGYQGLGEVSVFVFFGVVAVVGTAFVQTEQVTWLALVASVPVGLLASALLVVNNLRDIPTDAVAGKRTLAVRLGDRRTRMLYVALVVAALALGVLVAVTWTEWALLSLLALVPAVPPVGQVVQGATGPALVTALRETGRTQLAFGLLLALGLALG
jgi:1,4-dihydroxy-2-naphthoate polyprenyltransferase